MAGEVLAWLDEKIWTDKDKVSVAAGCLAALMLRVAKDKDELDRIKKYFLTLVDTACEEGWKALEGPEQTHE